VVELTRLAVAERVATAGRQHSSSRRSAGHPLGSPSSPRRRRPAPGRLLRGL